MSNTVNKAVNFLNKITDGKKRRNLFLIFAFLSAAVMIIIFFFSSQTAEQSDKVSTKVRESQITVIENVMENVETEQRNDFIHWLTNWTRKLAHIFLYTILGFFFFGGVICLKKPKRIWKKAIISVALTFLYAVSDEIHQIFVDGRSCEFPDMLFDLGGIAAGTLLMLLVYGIFSLFHTCNFRRSVIQ